MDTIYKRDERQRAILANIVFHKLVRMAFVLHEFASYEIKQLEFPKEEFRKEAKLNGSFVVDWNKEKILRYFTILFIRIKEKMILMNVDKKLVINYNN